MGNMVFQKEELELLAYRLLLTGGLREDDARQIAEDLVLADMRGLASHGISRIPMYLKRIECNCVNPKPDIKVEQAGMAVLKVHGDDGMGFLVAHRAVEKGYVCMVYTNSSAALPAFGGRTAFLGAAPFAAGMPGGYESPAFILDMAMTVTARGKIRVAMINNQPIAEGLALDQDGNPTTDARKAFEGICLPFGGAKGAALAMLMDMMAGMYTGSNYAGDVSSLYYRFDEPQNLGHMIFVMRPDLFVTEDEYKKRMDVYYKRLKTLPRAAGVEEILMPGEPEERRLKEAMEHGVSVTREIMESLYLEAQNRNVRCPEVFGTQPWVISKNSGAVVFEKENR